MTEHRAWQRETALRKVNEARDEAAKEGVAMGDRAAAAIGARAVGVTADQVLAWMRGAM